MGQNANAFARIAGFTAMGATIMVEKDYPKAGPSKTTAEAVLAEPKAGAPGVEQKTIGSAAIAAALLFVRRR
ncbi:hypothetical protein [Rhizorhabdus wittichii]|uniref:hypothetical protein n=1 Tax=Rhizorhabdus wittichii TaxID=160791 RepID=UPI00178C3CE4|nr:hypothetical protein [Rhizorhabdus wittichii]